MKILIIDNYDSFTYNLVHLVNELDHEVEVWRNDQYQIADVAAFEKIILSPGPGIPAESGLLMETIKAYAPSKSIFGVCLGLQAITECFGGSLYNLDKPLHGIATKNIVLNELDPLFQNCPKEFQVGRYHSWAANKHDFPKELSITAEDEQGIIMALSHKHLKVKAVQFHPESILTEYGKVMLNNWISYC